MCHLPTAWVTYPASERICGERDLALQSAGHAVHRGDQQPVAHRQPAGHDRRPGRGTGRLAVTRREHQPVTGEPIDVRCGSADGDAAAVAAEIAPADVVHEDHQHVRTAAGTGDERVEFGLRVLVRGRRTRTVARGCGRRFDRAGDRVDGRLRPSRHEVIPPSPTSPRASSISPIWRSPCWYSQHSNPSRTVTPSGPATCAL